MKDFFLPDVALLLSTKTWTCMSWIPLQQRFRVARPPLSCRPNGQDVSAFTEDSRDFRRQNRRPNTSTQSEVAGTEALAHKSSAHRSCGRGGREMQVAQAMMKELYDDGFEHPGKSTLLRARIRLGTTSIMFLRRRWFNSDHWPRGFWEPLQGPSWPARSSDRRNDDSRADARVPDRRNWEGGEPFACEVQANERHKAF